MTLQILRNGSEGKEVEHWQNFLIGEDFLQGQADGDFGPLTEQATKAFQRSQNITADGMVGPRTLGSAMVVGFDPGDSDLYRFLEVGAQQRADEDDRMDLVAHKVQRRMLQWAGAWVSLIVVLVVLVSVLGGRAYVNDLLVPQVDEKINDVN